MQENSVKAFNTFPFGHGFSALADSFLTLYINEPLRQLAEENFIRMGGIAFAKRSIENIFYTKIPLTFLRTPIYDISNQK